MMERINLYNNIAKSHSNLESSSRMKIFINGYKYPKVINHHQSLEIELTHPGTYVLTVKVSINPSENFTIFVDEDEVVYYTIDNNPKIMKCIFFSLIAIFISLLSGVMVHPAYFLLMFIFLIYMILYIVIYGYFMRNLLVLEEIKRFKYGKN